MSNRSRRTAQIIRQRRKRRQQRAGSAQKLGRYAGLSAIILLILLVVMVLGTAGTGVGVYAVYARQLPPADSIVDAQADTFYTTILYDNTGQFSIYEVIDPLGGDRQYITVDDVPDHFLNATVAIEDASFYENPGFDLQGMLRALWANSTSDQLQGGSTITQQLVKNVLIPPDERDDVSFDRKLKEIILASEISRLYSKDQILEWYINTNFYGNLAYGVEAASRVYFDKPARNLTLAESALLAAIPQFPLLNPIDNPEAARERQRVVLETMVFEGYITRTQADEALAQPVVIKSFAQRFNIAAPHFALYARREAEAILNNMGLDGSRMVSRDGLRIYTTLDLDLQRQMECVARSHVTRLAGGDPNFVHSTNIGGDCLAAQYLPPLLPEEIGRPRTVTNASGLVLKATTGEIVAMLGSVDYWNEGIDGNYNAALALRQPASTFKPFVYATAFFTPIDSNTVVTPATMLYDVRTEFNNGGFEPYAPDNIDLQFHGPVSVREALANSYNIPAVQVLNWIGLNPVLTTAHKLGINSMNSGLSAYGLSLALGTAEASLLDMTYAYNVFNNLGMMVGSPVPADEAQIGYRQLNPVAVLRIETRDGEILWEYSEAEGTFDRRSILEPGMAYMITDILADNEARWDAFPRGNAMELSRPAAVKTGTSDDFRDSWTIGYTPQYTAGVWVGNNNNQGMGDVTGLMGSAPIWHAVMEYIHAQEGLPVETWARPQTIIETMVCEWSGLLPSQNCPAVNEIFYSNPTSGIDYRPYQVDNYYTTVRVNFCNNTLATAYSPTECVTEKVYFNFPQPLLAWAQSTPGVELPPTVYDTSTSVSIGPVVISEPAQFDMVSGLVEIRGNADDGLLPAERETSDQAIEFFRVDFGRGSSPNEWQQIGPNQAEPGTGILLGAWDTSNLPDGLYTLRLTLERKNSSIEVANREVTVDNTPPVARFTSLEVGKTYSVERDVFIELQVEPSDNYQVETVEFYLDGELLATIGEQPYLHLWEITKTGEATFWVVVTDAAGNQAESERITVQLVP
jgi:membrane peptidoglycan carboxypeptidase